MSNEERRVSFVNPAATVAAFKRKILDALWEVGLPDGEPGTRILDDGNGTRVFVVVSQEKSGTENESQFRGIYNVVIYAENKAFIHKPKPSFFLTEKMRDQNRGLRRPEFLEQPKTGTPEFEKERPLDVEKVRAAFRPVLAEPKHLDLVMAAAASLAVPASSVVKGLVDYWKSLGLKVGRRPRDYEAAVHAVRDLLHGKKFQRTCYEHRNRKFSTEEIKTTIDNFAKAVLDDNYLPARNSKKKLARYTLPLFVYNPFVKRRDGTKGDSIFLSYLGNPPKPARTMRIVDEYPNGSATLKRLYEQQALGGVKPKYTSRQNHAVQFALMKGIDILQRNKGRVALPQAVFGPEGIMQSRVAELLWEAMVRGGEPSRVRLAWFNRMEFYDHDFVSYLCGQGILEMDQHKSGRRDDDE